MLASAGSAYKYGQEFHVKARAAKDAEGVARTEKEVAEVALGEVRALRAEQQRDTTDKNAELARGVAYLMALAKENGIKIGSIGSNGLSGSGSKPFESIFAPVPLTDGKLHKADILLKAQYGSYDGFLKFFEEVRSSGMAIQSVTVRSSNFEASIRVMGV